MRVSNQGSWAAVPCGRLSKNAGWNEAQRCVRSTVVIVLAPSFNLVPGVVKRKEPVKAAARAAGFDDFLVKPVSPTLLLETPHRG